MIKKAIIVVLSAFGGALVTHAGFQMIPHSLYIPWLVFNVWGWIAMPCIVWAAKKDEPKKESL